MGILVITFSAFSAALIACLCLGDPKRRRAMSFAGAAHSASSRRLILIFALMPGMALIVIGNAAGFLVWLGASAVVGWLTTLNLSSFRIDADNES